MGGRPSPAMTRAFFMTWGAVITLARASESDPVAPFSFHDLPRLLGVAMSRLVPPGCGGFLHLLGLDFASAPRPIYRLSSSPTRTLPPMMPAIVVNAIWCRPAASTDQT